MATTPKTRKNANTASESSSTCTAWAIRRTRTRLAFSSPRTSASLPRSVRLAATSTAARSSGVVRHASTISSASMSSSNCVELLVEPHEQESDRGEAEQQGRAPEHPSVQAGGDLPDLGVDEQERHEQQQHRKGPRRQGEQQPEAAKGPAQRPLGDRQGVQRPRRIGRHHEQGDGQGTGWPPGLLRQQTQGDAGTGAEDHGSRADQHQAAAAEPPSHPVADGVDEVGQTVVDEPLLGRDPGRGPGVGPGRPQCWPRCRQATRIPRALSTSSRIVSIRPSTDSNLTIPRRRSTNDTSTSTPYSSRSVRSRT